MGVIIYVNGEIETNASPDVMEKFLKIVNDHGEKAFEADVQALSFRCDEYEGYDPTERFVLKPLRELVRLAKENGVRLDGYIQVDSDWSDYDNLAVNVSEDGLTTGNKEIWNAGTDELIEELKKRGIPVPVGERFGQIPWRILRKTGGEAKDHALVFGTKEKVRDYLARIVKATCAEGEFATDTPALIKEDASGTLTGYVSGSSRSVIFSACPQNGLFVLYL